MKKINLTENEIEILRKLLVEQASELLDCLSYYDDDETENDLFEIRIILKKMMKKIK